ncbi:MAG TPA: hypothetical protein VM778_11260 [Gemmatimonadota bacterium]|nr:hypothetical protein [Gemmatimonadota bacterium]
MANASRASRSLLAAALALGLGVAAACGGSADTTGPPLADPAGPGAPPAPDPAPTTSPPLDRAAILSFWNDVLRDQALGGLAGGDFGPGGALAPAGCETACDPETGVCRLTCSVERELACELGGLVTTSREIERSLVPGEGDFTFAFSSRTRIESCGKTIGERIVTFQGAPDLTCEGSLAFAGGRPAGTWTIRSSGAVSFAAEGGEAGFCVIDVDWSLDTATGVVTGTADESHCCPDPDEPACAEG